jgi:hypothetical protein
MPACRATGNRPSSRKAKRAATFVTASVPIPKFARIYRTLCSELRNRRTLAIPSAALNPELANGLAAIVVRTSGSRHLWPRLRVRESGAPFSGVKRAGSALASSRVSSETHARQWVGRASSGVAEMSIVNLEALFAKVASKAYLLFCLFLLLSFTIPGRHLSVFGFISIIVVLLFSFVLSCLSYANFSKQLADYDIDSFISDRSYNSSQPVKFPDFSTDETYLDGNFVKSRIGAFLRRTCIRFAMLEKLSA